MYDTNAGKLNRLLSLRHCLRWCAFLCRIWAAEFSVTTELGQVSKKIAAAGQVSRKLLQQKNGQVSRKFAAEKKGIVSREFAAAIEGQVSRKFAAAKNGQVSRIFFCSETRSN